MRSMSEPASHLPTIVDTLTELLDRLNKEARKPDEVDLRRCLNETFFSDTLAWLLDSRGSHGLGVAFANRFVRDIGHIRSGTDQPRRTKQCKNCPPYARRATMLKSGKTGRGSGATGFSLKNAAVLREFYLTSSIGKRDWRGPRYCDVVLLDLDSADHLMVVVENKLFASNHRNQLEEYFDQVETKYERAKTREFVYLTLAGVRPVLYDERDKSSWKNWVRMSWTGHVHDALAEVVAEKSNVPQQVGDFLQLLGWLKALVAASSAEPDLVNQFRAALLTTAADCLVEELERLRGPLAGTWMVNRARRGDLQTVVFNSRTPRTHLHLHVLPNFSVLIQTHRGGKATHEKILLPFGSHPDQVFNLVDLVARDVFHLYFKDWRRYLGKTHLQTVTVSLVKRSSTVFLEFVHRYRHELQVLLALSPRTWEAQREDQVFELGDVSVSDNN